MTITVPGPTAPSVGFEVPLEMLAACHLRVQDQCATLSRLPPHLLAQGSDRPAQEAAAAVMRYFDTSAQHHHQDEEQDLFPAVLESMAGSDAICLREIIGALLADHRELDSRWQVLRGVLVQVAAGIPARLAQEEVAGFAQLYQRHIAREESELLPMAARLLDVSTLDRIGRNMRLRRAVPDAATG